MKKQREKKVRAKKEKKHKNASKPNNRGREWFSRVFNRLTLGKKYGLGMLVVIVLFSLSIIATFVSLTVVKRDVGNEMDGSERSITIVNMQKQFREQGNIINSYILDSNPAHIDEMRRNDLAFKELSKTLKSSMSDKEHQTKLTQILSNEDKIVKLFNKDVVDGVVAQNKLAYTTAKMRADQIITDNVITLDSLNEIIQSERDTYVNRAQAILSTAGFILLGALVVSIIIGSGIMIVITRTLNKQLGILVKTAKRIAQGELNVELPHYNGKDEIAQLSDAVDMMRQNLQGMIQEISAVSTHVTEKSEELTKSSSEVRQASLQIATTMTQLSAGADDQAKTASNIAEMMDGYVDKINHATIESKDVQSVSTTILHMTKEGNTLMNESTVKMEDIHRLVKTSVDKVKGLDAQTKQISKLVNVIRDIADQTNLLALNAAIEAARAGDHGRGFAVVADEVRKLAEQVSHSVSDITSIVKGIQAESHEVVSSLVEGYEQVESGAGQIQHTGKTFQNIHQSITNMDKSIVTMTTNLNDISNVTSKINESIESIASVSEESAAGIEQASVSVHQSNASIEDVSDNSAYLAQLADQLNQMLLRFKL
ncbi:methyl-accepting chemotaxis protein [Priestia koreensis]|uniref:methyl-accepting chemotaxis protein n=1 Tax=Priestia koreensis TaxID=284581 RepID=UPI0006A95F2F|nr:methyl-accepting chemotaxis protein [Priestia koreensis]